MGHRIEKVPTRRAKDAFRFPGWRFVSGAVLGYFMEGSEGCRHALRNAFSVMTSVNSSQGTRRPLICHRMEILEMCRRGEHVAHT